jgi:hypothetical protein
MGHSCLAGHLCKDRHNKVLLNPNVRCCSLHVTLSKLTEQPQARSLQVFFQERLQSRLENVPPLAPIRHYADACVPILRKSRLPRIGHLCVPARQRPRRRSQAAARALRSKLRNVRAGILPLWTEVQPQPQHEACALPGLSCWLLHQRSQLYLWSPKDAHQAEHEDVMTATPRLPLHSNAFPYCSCVFWDDLRPLYLKYLQVGPNGKCNFAL